LNLLCALALTPLEQNVHKKSEEKIIIFFIFTNLPKNFFSNNII
jgi:hypothetical protein